jgi:hypothetical protein
MNEKTCLYFACLLSIGLTMTAQKSYIIFANGYKGLSLNSVTTENGFSFERDSYWLNYDDTICERFPGCVAVYIDGHHPISTSVHRTKLNSFSSYFLSRFGWFKSKSNWTLNDRPNPEGFALRKANGQKCGEAFLAHLLKNRQEIGRKDTLHFVCHSMGYAYTLGFLKAVENHVVLGKILILAPESPAFEGYAWSAFEEVWQYGSNRHEPDADPTYLQDGIAPQAPVKGIETVPVHKGGRVFVPKHAKRGFIRSHHLNWFEWFHDIRPGQRGYFGM